MVANKGSIKAKVEMDPKYKVPRRLYDIDEAVARIGRPDCSPISARGRSSLLMASPWIACMPATS